jgi:bZIP transcription factor
MVFLDLQPLFQLQMKLRLSLRTNLKEAGSEATCLRAARKKEGKDSLVISMHVITYLLSRLMQNRVSAYRFRIKRKQEFETLKQYVNELVSENDNLRQEVRYTMT